MSCSVEELGQGCQVSAAMDIWYREHIKKYEYRLVVLELIPDTSIGICASIETKILLILQNALSHDLDVTYPQFRPSQSKFRPV